MLLLLQISVHLLLFLPLAHVRLFLAGATAAGGDEYASKAYLADSCAAIAIEEYSACWTWLRLSLSGSSSNCWLLA
jgi:hypothetical protein